MKTLLRILVILISIVIVVIALLPPEKSPKTVVEAPVTAATPVPQNDSHSQKLIKDLLGGAAIEKGKEAKEKISELNKKREKEFEENGL